MYYTGVHKATVKKDVMDVDMLPGEGEWSFLVGVGCRKKVGFVGFVPSAA